MRRSPRRALWRRDSEQVGVKPLGLTRVTRSVESRENRPNGIYIQCMNFFPAPEPSRALPGPRQSPRTQKKFKQTGLFGREAAADSDNPLLTVGNARLRELEEILSHDPWDPVEGRETLWLEVDKLLTRHPNLRTVLRVPARAHELPEFLRGGYTAGSKLTLVSALEYGDEEAVKCLLHAGADVDAPCKTAEYGMVCPLTYALVIEDDALVDLLVRHGARVQTQDGAIFSGRNIVRMCARARETSGRLTRNKSTQTTPVL